MLCHMSLTSFIHVYALPTLCIITDHQMIVIRCRYSILSLNSHLLTHFISFASQVMLWYFIDGLINILLSFESNQRAHARFVFILYPNHSLIPILIPFPPNRISIDRSIAYCIVHMHSTSCELINQSTRVAVRFAYFTHSHSHSFLLL